MSDKGTVLIVEDQEGFRQVYMDILTYDGYGVLTAEDGELGWEMAKEKKPDLILLDLGLPKLDGFEVLKRLRADPETKDIPVIIFSVMGEQKDIKRALEMGANDYTVKGFYTPRQVLSKIKMYMPHGQAGKPQGEKVSYKIHLKGDLGDAARLQSDVELTAGFRCPHCDVEMVIEMFPDFVREGAHWYSSKLVCPKCAKAV